MKRPLSPAEHWTVARLCYWHLDRARYREAEALARGLLTLDPRDGQAWLYYGEARFHQNDLTEAARGYGEAARYLTDSAAVWLRLGDCYLRQGKRSEARQALQQAAACCGEDEHLLARVQALRGRA